MIFYTPDLTAIHVSRIYIHVSSPFNPIYHKRVIQAIDFLKRQDRSEQPYFCQISLLFFLLVRFLSFIHSLNTNEPRIKIISSRFSVMKVVIKARSITCFRVQKLEKDDFLKYFPSSFTQQLVQIFQNEFS